MQLGVRRFFVRSNRPSPIRNRKGQEPDEVSALAGFKSPSGHLNSPMGGSGVRCFWEPLIRADTKVLNTDSSLAFWPDAMFLEAMTAEAIIQEIKALPQAEREQVVRFVVEQDDSWIPESFKRGMADAAAGRVVEMESALRETPPPHLR